MRGQDRRSAAVSVISKVMPLVLKRRAEAFDNDAYLFELKYDGFRALLEVDNTGARLVSRNRNRFRHLDTLAAALAKRLKVSDAILDGEVICVDETGRPIFIDLLRRKEPCFVAFDLLWLNGEIFVRCHSLSARLASAPITGALNHLIAEAMSVEGRASAHVRCGGA